MAGQLSALAQRSARVEPCEARLEVLERQLSDRCLAEGAGIVTAARLGERCQQLEELQQQHTQRWQSFESRIEADAVARAHCLSELERAEKQQDGLRASLRSELRADLSARLAERLDALSKSLPQPQPEFSSRDEVQELFGLRATCRAIDQRVGALEQASPSSPGGLERLIEQQAEALLGVQSAVDQLQRAGPSPKREARPQVPAGEPGALERLLAGKLDCSMSRSVSAVR